MNGDPEGPYIRNIDSPAVHKRFSYEHHQFSKLVELLGEENLRELLESMLEKMECARQKNE